MNNANWTKEEEHDLLTMARADFLRKYEHRTPDGARQRYGTLNKNPKAVLVADPVKAEEIEDDQELSADAYDRYFALIERAVEEEANLSVGVSTLEYSFPDQKPVGIAFTSDWHIGAGGVEYKRLREDLGLIGATDGLYAVFNGDCLENTKTHTKSATALYSAAIPKPRHQLELARRLAGTLSPTPNGRYVIDGEGVGSFTETGGEDPAGLVGDGQDPEVPGGALRSEPGKWLAWGEGNHDAFDYRAGGTDRIAGLCEDLGIPYFREKGLTLKIDVAGQEYTLVAKHQYTGQSRISKSNSARRLWTEWPWDFDSADVVALAHLHEPDTHSTVYRGHDVHMLRSGSYKTTDAWAESNGFRPSYGVPLVILFPGERKIIPFHGSQFREGVAYLDFLRNSGGYTDGVGS